MSSGSGSGALALAAVPRGVQESGPLACDYPARGGVRVLIIAVQAGDCLPSLITGMRSGAATLGPVTLWGCVGPV